MLRWRVLQAHFQPPLTPLIVETPVAERRTLRGELYPVMRSAKRSAKGYTMRYIHVSGELHTYSLHTYTNAEIGLHICVYSLNFRAANNLRIND